MNTQPLNAAQMIQLGYVDYLPFEKRTADYQYRNMLQAIMERGRVVKSIQGDECRRLIGYTLRYNMKNGFALMTERDLTPVLRGAMGEAIGFAHGARTFDELKAFGCPEVYWARWLTKEKCATFGLPPGDLGDGSYGAQYGKPTCEGGEYSQVEAVLALAKEMPFSRTLRVTNWRTPELLLKSDPLKRRTVVAPCHGDYQLHIDELTGELEFTYIQRAGDCGTGLYGNLVHSSGLGLMFAKALGLKLVEVVHIIVDAHVYSRQYEAVEKLISITPGPLPTVTLDDSVTDFFAFHKEHFHLSDYHPTGPKVIIDTPV